MESHDDAVSAIAARVKSFHEQQKPFRMYHGATNSTRTSHRQADNVVDTSQLDNVLSVDVQGKTALVEPNVSMELLVTAVLKHNLVPLVVMELPGITVGGGFSGTSGESSSFRYGTFDGCVGMIEIVLPDGTVTRASKTEKQDLFWGAASAFGTLGVVTLLEVQLMDAKAYVRLEYLPSGGAEETARVIQEECGKEANDYVDGIAFSPAETVVCVGRLTDELPEGKTPMRLLGRSDPWFFTRLQDLRAELKAGQEKVVDYIPLRDYLFRWDRGSFWTCRYVFSYFMLVPFNRITRYLFDSLFRARPMYRGMHKSGLLDFYMIQDVGIPFPRAAEFQSWLDANLAIYPLWLCPLRVRRDDPDSAHGLHSEFGIPGKAPDLLNYGVWGPLAGDRRAVVAKNRALEQEVLQLGGKKWLYAHAYYEEDEFWAHYDRASYDTLRERYGAGYLPSVYDKVKVDVEGEETARRATWWARMEGGVMSVWPVAGLKGLWYAWMGGEYLIKS